MADSEVEEALHLADKPETRAEALMRAFTLARSGQADGAQRIYDRVGAFKPLHPLRAFWPLAVTAGNAGEEWATPALKRADLHINYAQLQAAAEILAGVTDATLRPSVLASRARIALTGGQAGEAAALAGQARGLAPESSYAAIVHGAALFAAMRPTEAIAPLTFAAVARAGAHALLGTAWYALGDYAKSAEAYKRALAFDPDDPLPANNLMPALLGARDYAHAITHADGLLARGMRDTSALAFKSVALSEMDLAQELDALTNPAAFIQTEWLQPPAGYADLAAFHRALAQEIAADPTLAYERNTTKFGHQTTDLAAAHAPALQKLNAAMMDAGRRRAATVRAKSDHPFDRAAPKDFQLYSWAVVMREEGHQAPHFHPNGWLSGVYYVEVPAEISETDPTRQGWLEFGRSEDRWHRRSGEPTHQVCPKPGLLVTFPSYFWHSTRPLHAKTPRISFAFDIIPVQ